VPHTHNYSSPEPDSFPGNYKLFKRKKHNSYSHPWYQKLHCGESTRQLLAAIPTPHSLQIHTATRKLVSDISVVFLMQGAVLQHWQKYSISIEV